MQIHRSRHLEADTSIGKADRHRRETSGFARFTRKTNNLHLTNVAPLVADERALLKIKRSTWILIDCCPGSVVISDPVTHVKGNCNIFVSNRLSDVGR